MGGFWTEISSDGESALLGDNCRCVVVDDSADICEVFRNEFASLPKDTQQKSYIQFVHVQTFAAGRKDACGMGSLEFDRICELLEIEKYSISNNSQIRSEEV